MTAVLSGRSRKVIRRNAAILPVYSLMLGLPALLGFAAIYKKTSVFGLDHYANAQLAVPHCSSRSSRTGSPEWRSRRSPSGRWFRRRSCRSSSASTHGGCTDGPCWWALLVGLLVGWAVAMA